MSVELIRASRLTDAVPYAYASIVPAGVRLVHTAGACPIDEHDRVVAPGDVAGQARQVMDNLEVALQAAGAGLTDVVRTTVYVASTDQVDLVTAWNVVRARFGDHDAPSTLLGVTVLGYRASSSRSTPLPSSGEVTMNRPMKPGGSFPRNLPAGFVAALSGPDDRC